MDEKNLENVEQPEQTGSNEFGKFKDADSLFKAYTNLEAEFTKKSQRLASLETEAEKIKSQVSLQAEKEKMVDDFVTKFENFKPFSSALKESLKKDENCNLYEEAISLISNNYKSAESYSKDDEFLNNYIYSNNQIREKILKDYILNITQNSPIKVETSGSSISLTPPRVPQTIKEAGIVAKSIIKQK